MWSDLCVFSSIGTQSCLLLIFCKRHAMNPEFDRYADHYSDFLKDPMRDRFAGGPTFFHERKWLIVKTFLRSRGLDPKTLSWLDVGCGKGDLLQIAGPSFARATGCDPSSRMPNVG